MQTGIINPNLISHWVCQYRSGGPDALRPKKKRTTESIGYEYAKWKNSFKIEKEDTDTSIEHVKELEAELHKLRIENAFLKELRRLRLEDEAKMRERRESSTVSEENYKLKDLLSYISMPKATYMYWQKRFDRRKS